jgi:hypothetical protein
MMADSETTPPRSGLLIIRALRTVVTVPMT